MKTVSVALKVGPNETLRTSAYQSSTPGLVIHRQVVWVPAKEEHKFASKWNITHLSTGKALLRPSQCLKTMTAAEEVAKALATVDWETDSPVVVQDQLDQALAGETVKNAEATKTKSSRFVVRRNQDGPGYCVVDVNTDTTVSTFMHRGLAREDAMSRNEKEST